MLLLYILWDDSPIFMISGSNEQLQQQLEYTLLKLGCHSWWISKMQSDTLEERYAIKFCFKIGKNGTEKYGMLQTVARRSHGPHSSCLYQRHLCQWRCSTRNSRKRIFSAVWVEVQGSRAVGGWRTSARIGDRDGTQWIVVEAGKHSTRSSQCLYATNSILLVWSTCRAPSDVQLASCGLWNTQEASKFSHEGLGWWSERHHTAAYNVWDHRICAAGWSGSWGLMCGQQGAECMGRCQFPSNRSSLGVAQDGVGGCLLAATWSRHLTHQLNRTRCHIERHQFVPPVASQGATHKDGFCVCVSLDIRHWLEKHVSAPRQQVRCSSGGGWVDSRSLWRSTDTRNIADRLTRVLQQCFEAMKKENGLELLIDAAHIDELDVSQIMAIHRGNGHPGVQHTTYFVRKICPTIVKAAVKSSIQICEECQSIDLAPIQWEKGKLEVNRNWQRLVMDITHYSTHHFLTLTDCGPSRFFIWKQLAKQDSVSVIHQLEAVFFEHGPPHEILTDNDTAFSSKEFQAFAHEWGIQLQFRCAYAIARNGIAERCHCTVKRIAARMCCPIQEAVYWYNITPRDDISPSTTPANRIYRYEVGVKGANHATASLGPKHSSYQIRERV